MTLRSSGTPTGQTTVTFSSAMASANYHVAITITSDTDWGNSAGWGYVLATSKTVNGFTIVLNESDGGAKNAPANTTVDWIVIPTN